MKTLDFSKEEIRKQFIHENESGVYGGKDINDNNIIVQLDKGEGMTVKTETPNGRWFEVRNYDENGLLEDDYVEKIEDERI